MEQDIINPIPSKPFKPWYKRSWFIALAIFIVFWFGVPTVLDIFFPRKISINNPPANSSLPKIAATDVWTKDDPTLGLAEAPVAIVEFADFQCPFCKDSVPVLKELLKSFPEAVKVQFRDSPITSIHTEALAAAEAANCAGRQNKYWLYHDALYNQQDNLKLETYNSIATSLNLDIDQFNRCLNGHLTLSEIKEDYEYGQKFGVTGTPTFFVNGRLMAGHIPLDLWKKIIPMVLKEDLKK